MAISTTADIFAATESVLPLVREHSSAIEAGRRLPDVVIDALRSAGAFRMPMARSWGGPEMALPDQLRLVEMISAADPAAGWCVMIGSDAGFYSSHFPDDVARRLWPSVDAITAGWLQPAGRAVPVDGGYSLSGRWQFGSCCLHADVIVGGFLVCDEHGVPQMGPAGPDFRIAVAPAEDWEILDTWYTTGLAGSGSNDYQCNNMFVPAEHTFTWTTPSLRDGPVYALSSAFFTNAHGVPLGLARRALDEAIAVAQTKMLMPQFVKMADVPRVRDTIAESETLFRSTRAYAFQALDAVWAALQAGRQPSPEQRADLTFSRTQCFRTAREVSLRMLQLVGTQAIYTGHILDRLVRDSITMGQHIIAAPMLDEGAAQLLLGQQPTGVAALLV
jgi:alkylation response protein AidB-like acyl-CoA dehydrogenase